MKNSIIFSIFIFANCAIASDFPVVKISPKYCEKGVQFQPRGNFAISVFCDDALGTNIAIFLNDLHGPFRGKYALYQRYWQNYEWGADVTSFVWMPEDTLIISTSRIYGSGKVLKLDLENQKSEVLYTPSDNICVTEIARINESKLTVKLTDCDLNEEEIEIAI